MPRVLLRAAGPDDIATVLRFWQAAAEGTDRTDSAEAVVALLARDPHALVLAESDGQLVGTVVAGWDGWRAHLCRLAVRPDHRRQGVARMLLRAAEERLAALGATRFDAMVLDGNDLGRSLWSAAGYSRQDAWSRWTRRPDS